MYMILYVDDVYLPSQLQAKYKFEKKLIYAANATVS